MITCTDKGIFTLFEEIAKLNSIKLKIELLRKHKNCKILRKIFEIITDNNLVLNVGARTLEKIPCGRTHRTDFNAFLKLIQKLQRTSSLYEREALLKEFFKNTNQFTCKWYKRILLKDLRIGVGDEQVQMVFGPSLRTLKPTPQNFKIMLGYDISALLDKGRSLREILSLCDIWFVEPKYDGLRAITIVYPNGTFEVYSRNRKRLPNVEFLLVSDIKVLFQRLKYKFRNGFVLDGEVFSRNWNETMSKVFTQSTQIDIDNYKHVRYYVFDLIDLETFVQRGQTPPYFQRKSQLDKVIKNLKVIKPVPHTEFRSERYKDENKLFKRVQNMIKRAVEKGFEGIMLKCARASYTFNRSQVWLKGKPVKSDDFKVIDVDKKGKKPGQIAAIVIDVNGVPTKVGSGLSEKLRKCLYKHPEDIIGEYVEVAYYEITRDGKLRHPRLLRVRLDKSPYKNKKYACLLDALK